MAPQKIYPAGRGLIGQNCAPSFNHAIVLIFPPFFSLVTDKRSISLTGFKAV